MRDRCRTYRDTFPEAEVLYAAKAFLCRAVIHWMEEEGLGIEQPQLELTGLHCHVGWQIISVKPYLAAVRRAVGLMARLHEQHGLVLPSSISAGGTVSPAAPVNLLWT